jgi:hypothetical protein
MDTLQEQARKAMAVKLLEEKFSKERESLYEFLKTYWKLEKREELDENDHIREICFKLEQVYR